MHCNATWCRPYVRLTEYDIVEPAMRSVIKAKLTTRKRGGCGGQHCSSREELGCYRWGLQHMCHGHTHVHLCPVTPTSTCC